MSCFTSKVRGYNDANRASTAGFPSSPCDSISQHGTWINGKVLAIGHNKQRKIELVTDKGTFEVATGMTTIQNAKDVQEKLEGHLWPRRVLTCLLICVLFLAVDPSRYMRGEVFAMVYHTRNASTPHWVDDEGIDFDVYKKVTYRYLFS